MTSDSIDIGLNAGMDLVLTVKGAPVRAVAAIASRPLDLGIVVRPDLPATSAADLKGRKIGLADAPPFEFGVDSENTQRSVVAGG